MGIDLPAFEFITRATIDGVTLGRTLVLGRQRMVLHDFQRARLMEIVESAPGLRDSKDWMTGNADTWLSRLGADPLVYLDVSPYEGASAVHDLNLPLPQELVGKFDTVIDIGSLEHVFNIGQAMKSVAELVRLGGHVLLLTVADNHLGHGFWQFGPEVFYRTFDPENGFGSAQAFLHIGGRWTDLVDPSTTGERQPIKTGGYAYIAFRARRERELEPFAGRWPVQADYAIAHLRDQADALLEKGRYKELSELLNDALARFPGNPAVLKMLKEFTFSAAEVLNDSPESAEVPAERFDRAACGSALPSLGQVTEATPRTVALGQLVVVGAHPLIPERTLAALENGRYEFKEREVVRRLVSSKDRIVELGAGMGIVSCTLSTLGEHVVSFDGHAGILTIAEQNCMLNDLRVEFHWAVPMPPSIRTPTVDFIVRRHFEASQVTSDGQALRVESIPTVDLHEILGSSECNTLVADVQGFEYDLCVNSTLPGVTKVILEIHNEILGPAKVKTLLDRFRALGFAPRLDLIFGNVVALERCQGQSSAQSEYDELQALLEFDGALRKGEEDQADQIVERIGAAKTTNPYFLLSLSQLYESLDRPCFELLVRASGLNSEDPNLFKMLASEADRMGETQIGVFARRELDRLTLRGDNEVTPGLNVGAQL